MLLLPIGNQAVRADPVSGPMVASSEVAANELAGNIGSGGQSRAFLVGVYVNRREREAINVLLDNGEIWVPWKEFLELAGIRASEGQGGILLLETSIGEIRFPRKNFRMFEGTEYLSFRMLEERFRVFPSFDQSLFAIALQIPWTPAPPKAAARPALKPDVTAPATSIGFIHGMYQYSDDLRNPASQQLELLSGGRFYNGIWDVDLLADPGRRIEPAAYHWTLIGSHSAFRLGTGQGDFPTMLSTSLFTGAQFGWTNGSILPYFDQPLSSAQNAFMTFNVSQLRTIDGSGPPAGIAELRFDGKAVARQTVRLDGRFSFPNVQMGTEFRKIEVYVYTRSILEKPSTVLDYTQSISSRALERGKVLVSGGVGSAGNPLLREPAASTGRPTAYGHLQYGVNEWLTGEAAVQQRSADSTAEGLGGVVLSLGSTWNASAYGARSNGHAGTELSLERHTRRSSLLLNSSRYGQDFMSAGQAPVSRKQLYASWQPANNASITLTGRQEQNAGNGIEFLRPGASLFLRNGLRFSVTPEYSTSVAYRYESAWYGSESFWCSAAYNARSVDTNASWRLSDRTSLRIFNQHGVGTSANLTSTYIDWYTTESRRTLLQFVAARSGRQAGFSLAYQRIAHAGIDFSLGYRYNMSNALLLDIDQNAPESPVSRHMFTGTLTFDFGWSGKRLQPVNHSTHSLIRGGIAGTLAVDRETGLQGDELRDIGILVNGYQMPQNQQDGNYFVGYLKPGLYRVSVDPARLPVQVVPDRQSSIVEVKGCGITNVDIPLHVEYGVAGQIVDSSSNGIPGAYVEAWKRGGKERAGTGFTNEFGFYRIDGLRQGTYKARVVEAAGEKKAVLAEREFAIADDYVFDVDLQLPKGKEAMPKKQAAPK